VTTLPEKFGPAPGPVTETDWLTVDKMFIKQVAVALAGTVLPQHAHEYAHSSFLATGAAGVWVEGEHLGDFVAPHLLHIEAKKKHTFVTLEDHTTILCLHNATHDPVAQVFARHDIVIS
jgi:hypothetical protein